MIAIDHDEFETVVYKVDVDQFTAALIEMVERDRLRDVDIRLLSDSPMFIIYMLNENDGDDCFFATQKNTNSLEFDDDYRVEVIGSFAPFTPDGTTEAARMIRVFADRFKH